MEGLKKVAKFKAGLRCNLENVQMNLSNLKTENDVLNFLEKTQYEDSLIYF